MFKNTLYFMKGERVYNLLAILMALILPFSISASYVPLTLVLFLMFFNKQRPPKDFLLIIFLYFWRFITLVFNRIIPVEIKDIYDKMGYPAFSGFKGNPKVVIYAFAISSTSLAILGFLSKNFGILNMTLTEYQCVEKTCEVEFKKPKNVYISGDFVKIKNIPFKFGDKIATDENPGKGWKRVREITVNPLYRHITHDFVGFYGHKHHTASLFSFSSIMFFCLSLYYSPLFILAFIPSLYALILTNSYLYIYFTLLALSFVFFLRFGFLRNFPYVLLSTFPIIFALYFKSVISPKLIWSFSSRTVYWEIGINIWKGNPIFGVGYSQVSGYLKPYFEKGLIDNTAHLHNVYINSLAETGLIGLALILIITLYFILKYAVLYIKTGSTFALILASVWLVFSLVGIFEVNFDTTVLNLCLYFFMGIFEAGIRHSQRLFPHPNG